MFKFTSLACLAAVSAVQIKSQGLYDGEKFEVKVTQDVPVHKQCETGQVLTVNYEGRLKSNNNVFDSTKVKGPFSFSLGQAEVIECWDEGFKKMSVGQKATFNCPAEMAYGNVMKKNIPENSDLVFDVELLGCQNDEMADLDITALQSAIEQTGGEVLNDDSAGADTA